MPRANITQALALCILETPKRALQQTVNIQLNNSAFHLGLHCLLRLKQSLEKGILFYFEIITCDPLAYTMNHPKHWGSSHYTFTHMRNKNLIVTFKGGHLMWYR